mmetsp:Transcript_1260/g.3884  ORF Transcript_1260/g.3884 Transcript_1260/m.3884 type:complete len:154 (-) Transcript_1260:121-582(-)
MMFTRGRTLSGPPANLLSTGWVNASAQPWMPVETAETGMLCRAMCTDLSYASFPRMEQMVRPVRSHTLMKLKICRWTTFLRSKKIPTNARTMQMPRGGRYARRKCPTIPRSAKMKATKSHSVREIAALAVARFKRDLTLVQSLALLLAVQLVS